MNELILGFCVFMDSIGDSVLDESIGSIVLGSDIMKRRL